MNGRFLCLVVYVCVFFYTNFAIKWVEIGSKTHKITQQPEKCEAWDWWISILQADFLYFKLDIVQSVKTIFTISTSDMG